MREEALAVLVFFDCLGKAGIASWTCGHEHHKFKEKWWIKAHLKEIKSVDWIVFPVLQVATLIGDGMG